MGPDETFNGELGFRSQDSLNPHMGLTNKSWSALTSSVARSLRHSPSFTLRP